ncbi:MAG TPA: UDP-N-acetylmuramoyl-L-alanine--D-glutamate ligase, partial [Acetobacteraceae bacterium]|nr:UDP-N-acetylmuramoyl-L-alanine--D-glutamate ligase [Acetobacteraceae bacterium]
MSTFAPTLFSGKRFAVLGLGKNGAPAALALHAMGAEVVAWDDNAASRDALTAAARPAVAAAAHSVMAGEGPPSTPLFGPAPQGVDGGPSPAMT